MIDSIYRSTTEAVYTVATRRNQANGIYHWSLMQIEKSHPKGKWIMTDEVYRVYGIIRCPEVGISRSASVTDV